MGVKWIGKSEGGNELGCGFILCRIIIDVLYWMFTRFKVYFLLFLHQGEKSSTNLIIMY